MDKPQTDVVLDNGDYVNPARFGDDGTPGPADIEPPPPARDPYLSEALKYLIVIGALTLFAIVIGLVVLALL